MSTIKNRSLQDEVEIVNSLMSISETSQDFIRNLKLFKYVNERKIIGLFIRTSITRHALECKLVKAGFDTNCSILQVLHGKALVELPNLDKTSSISILGNLRV